MTTATYLCGGNLTPGPRMTRCANVLHDWPLASGYVDAHEVAMSRLYRKWANPRCPDCGLFGWRPGRIDPESDVLRPLTRSTV